MGEAFTTEHSTCQGTSLSKGSSPGTDLQGRITPLISLDSEYRNCIDFPYQKFMKSRSAIECHRCSLVVIEIMTIPLPVRNQSELF